MAESLRLAAIDLGAESGRVVLGQFDGTRVQLDVAHRFENRALWLGDGLHWNVTSLFSESLHGLATAARGGRLDGVGVNTWGCDYALLDESGRMLGLPFHYRDERTTDEVLARAHALVSRDELYRRTGIQTMAINTIFQLVSETGSAAARAADRIALIPDLFGYWLTGTLVNEVTIASTTGLLDARTRRWAADLAGRLGLARAPFDADVVDPGVELGPVLDRHQAAGLAVGATVRTVAGHDTGSAFAGAPLSYANCAVLSSGTWSLLGLELDEPQLGETAAAYNLTNERGAGDTVRLLRNVMGLWLVQECRREWAQAGDRTDYGQLQAVAARADSNVPLFDPDDDSLLRGGAMAQRIERLCERTERRTPRDRGELLRSILQSLACKYRLVLEQLERVSGRRVQTVHVIGGGAKNELLCQLTADLLQREVLAGPVEATALGNVLVQALAIGELSDFAQLRELSARSASPTRFDPGPQQAADQTYERFLAVTGLSAMRPDRTAA